MNRLPVSLKILAMAGMIAAAGVTQASAVEEECFCCIWLCWPVCPTESEKDQICQLHYEIDACGILGCPIEPCGDDPYWIECGGG